MKIGGVKAMARELEGRYENEKATNGCSSSVGSNQK
jgi:hypothetical protein